MYHGGVRSIEGPPGVARVQGLPRPVPPQRPDWNSLDAAILAVFFASCTAAFILEHVYGFSGTSPERTLGSLLASVIWGGICLAAAAKPEHG